MSKARPHAHIYEKWVRGLRTAVPDDKERCALLECIIEYQIAKVYGSAELPKIQDLSSAAAIAWAMLEGDLDELCEARKENNDRRRENGASRTEQDLIGADRTLQNNTIQNNTIQGNNNTTQALTNLAGQKALSEFALGLSLLRKGYIVKATKLHAVYAQAVTKHNPLAYAEKAGFGKFSDPAAGAVCANFVEATRCKDTRALELYGVAVDDEELQVRCTAAAEQAIGAAGMDNAQAYAAQVGAKFIEFYSNAE